jgi:DNA-directed RNA polymerase subunit M/transcription elongation factor TFIIS
MLYYAIESPNVEGGSMAKSSKHCPKCGGGIMERARSEDDAPIWHCRNCSHEMPRRTWKTKKRKEREQRINETAERLLRGWECAMGMRGYAGSAAEREGRQ